MSFLNSALVRDLLRGVVYINIKAYLKFYNTVYHMKALPREWGEKVVVQ